jgi:hypothetical protein
LIDLRQQGVCPEAIYGFRWPDSTAGSQELEREIHVLHIAAPLVGMTMSSTAFNFGGWDAQAERIMSSGYLSRLGEELSKNGLASIIGRTEKVCLASNPLLRR